MESLQELIEYNPYAVQYRYEAFEEVGGPLDRREVSVRVGKLLRMIEAMIEQGRQE